MPSVILVLGYLVHKQTLVTFAACCAGAAAGASAMGMVGLCVPGATSWCIVHMVTLIGCVQC